MHARRLLSLLIPCLFVASAAQAGVDLIAIGEISGHYEDYALDTAAALENGVAGNRLGGIGSGLAYAGCNSFIGLPDRGPNAVAYNSKVDDTASYIPRFHSLHMSLAPSEAGAALPYVLSAFVTDTTLLSSRTRLVYGKGTDVGLNSGEPALNDARRGRYYFSGRSDNFDAARLSTDPANGRLDPEGVRVSADGRSVFISDEYGPHVYQFDRASGRRIRAFTLPEKFAVKNQSPVGDSEISGNTAGRVANKGMEGLAITPDGSTLVGAMQSPLLQDGGTAQPYTRIVTIDIRSGYVNEYAYELTNIGSSSKPKYGTISEIVAVNDHEFLVDERDGKGLGDDSTAAVKRIYRIDLRGAQDVSGLAGADKLSGRAVPKSLFLDVVAVLNAHGIAGSEIPAKLEGLAFGPDVTISGGVRHTLFISNDNDYLGRLTDSNHPTGAENPNRLFVFAIDAQDLPDYVPQRLRGSRECDSEGNDSRD